MATEALFSMCSRKGHLQFFMKEYEKAAETYEAGLQHDPNNPELKDGIARCMEAVNKVQGRLHLHSTHWRSCFVAIRLVWMRVYLPFPLSVTHDM